MSENRKDYIGFYIYARPKKKCYRDGKQYKSWKSFFYYIIIYTNALRLYLDAKLYVSVAEKKYLQVRGAQYISVKLSCCCCYLLLFWDEIRVI